MGSRLNVVFTANILVNYIGRILYTFQLDIPKPLWKSDPLKFGCNVSRRHEF